ncbi:MULTISPECIES: alpha/beta hydrolase [unclassified Microcoleus]|uniref:alpha/beta hydrolase n=1 Tax=unclassified Microcoleus TaxID=2642155 RepID=UPI0025DD0D63|nr:MULTISPECIES: alpha/beta hydrolase [unclassified Microcoleus]
MPSISNLFVRGSLWTLALGFSFGIAAPGLAATTIVLPDQYSLLIPGGEVKVSELENFVNTGKVPSNLIFVDGLLSSIAKINDDDQSLLQQLQKQLKQPISINKNNPNSANDLSNLVKSLLPPNSTQTERQEAETLLAQKANNLTLIEFLKKLPVDKLTRDNFIDALRKMSPPAKPRSLARSIVGGQLFSTGEDVFVEVLRPITARYTSHLSLYQPKKQYIATNWEVGKKINLGSFSRGIELIFGIYVQNSRNTFIMGPGSRNGDGLPHARVNFIAPEIADVGFEDLWGGGDWDFNDHNFRFSGGISDSVPEPVPEPTTVLGSLAFGAVVSRWRMKRKQQQKVVNSTVD